MENQEVTSGNTQATPEVAPPAPGNDANLAARVAELERQSEGRLRDLQEERRKRQELEQRLSSVPVSPAVPPAEVAVEQDEVAKVLSPYIAPIRKQAEEALKKQNELIEKYQRDAALSYLAEKTGKSTKQVMSDETLLTRLDATARKWGFVGSFDEVARKAYEAMELEDFRAQQAERERSAKASANASLPAGSPPAPVANSREMSAEEFSRLPPREYERMDKEGSFRKVDGKFVYTPKR